jgi:hypothetical protein
MEQQLKKHLLNRLNYDICPECHKIAVELNLISNKNEVVE